MNFNNINNIAPYDFRSEDELMKTINHLSNLFVFERDNLKAYLEDPKLVSAYLYFFYSTNKAKFEKILETIPNLLNTLKQSDIIDVGCGPAPFFSAIGTEHEGELIGIEKSELMREMAKQIVKEAKFYSKYTPIESNLDSFVVFTHSFNEMGHERALGYINSYKPKNILFIEPGTKEVFHQLLEMRQALIEKGYRVQYPCAKESACPLAEKDDWCHQIITTVHSMEVERLCQKLKKDRRNMPVCMHWYTQNKKEDNQAMITRVYKETKFSFEWEVCSVDNEIENIQIMKKDYPKKEAKLFKDYNHGTKISYLVEKTLGDGKLRVKLI